MSELEKFDSWLNSDQVAALVIREPLVPVEGEGGVIFPATYAAAEDKKVFPGGYNIDPPEGEKNVCLVDSVGSQANRIEPLFAKPEYSGLIPQIVIQAGEKSVSLLEAGHRAGDAIVRCTALQQQIQDAFKQILRGNALPMAKLAPTSLIFGVWDSRDTQAKLPRLISSTVRAFDVKKLSRSAQFNPATNYFSEGLLDEATDTATGKAHAERGFIHVPATGTPGGVIASSGIRRDAVLSLAALRLLAAGEDRQQTLSLRRYILGLALVAFTAPGATYLRQGCNLVPDIDNPREFLEVGSDGTRQALKLNHAEALKFAQAAAKAFGVGDDRTVAFDKELAKRDIAGEGNTKVTRKAAAKKKAEATTAETK
ncbi:type I-G CRISPR-associated RAMP protein Csb1/Cas7g [Planctomicrobium sp. SH664]|uniref:type I-G CRISPR-associated RAMP protein Csb1/Cas7g n=1 Tax=Planctomicrobium sp. SH664 TaxID=3448125 RepID=UPI003F5B4179